MRMQRNDTNPAANLPDIDPGLTLLDVDDDLGVTPVQTLLLDSVLTTGSAAYWIDGAGAARTARLRELAPDRRLLERVRIARGFTPQQHASLLDRLTGRLANESPPAVVLATGVDRLYREDDLPTDRAEALFVRGVATLASVARDHEAPVLITRTTADAFTEPLENAARTHLRCEKTSFGPRFIAADGGDGDDGHATLAYRVGDGLVQTTIAFWREVLEHRIRRADAAAPTAVAAPTGPGWE